MHESGDAVPPMHGDGASGSSPTQEELNAYVGLRPHDIRRIVLCLLLEEGMKEELATFRVREDLRPQPVQRQEEFAV